MSLMRAFTTRRQKQPELNVVPAMSIGRAASQRAGRPILRNQISGPVELLQSTNDLSRYAPSISGTTPIPRHVSSGSSTSSNSGDDSDGSTQAGSIHSADNMTDASSINESPIEPAPNHLSCYFKPNVQTASPTPSRSPSLTQRDSFDAPDIPQRAASHSKRAHERVSRKRSIQRMMSPPPRTSRELRTSAEMFSFVEAPKENPFGNELAQLDEVAEEFGHVVSDAENDADAVCIELGGLACYGASDYLNEIQDLITSFYAEDDDQSSPDFGNWI